MATLIGGPSDYNETSSTILYGKGFGLGDSSTDQNGAEWRYVQASAAITQYDTVWVNETYDAAPITKALAGTTGQVASAQVAFASGDYGWVQVANGAVTLRVAASSTADSNLWTSDTAGVLTSTAATASHYPIFGFVGASAGSGGGVTAVAGYMAYPVVAKATGL